MLAEFLTSIEKYEKRHERLTEKGNLWLPFFFYEIAALHSQTERVGKYMIRPLLSLERLSFEEKKGEVSYRYGKEAEEEELLTAAEAGAEYFS